MSVEDDRVISTTVDTPSNRIPSHVEDDRVISTTVDQNAFIVWLQVEDDRVISTTVDLLMACEAYILLKTTA